MQSVVCWNCMTLLYQSCKIKHYLLKTMYFFVKTWSHREYQWLVLLCFNQTSFVTALLGMQCLCSGLNSYTPMSLFAGVFHRGIHLFKKTNKNRVINLISTCGFYVTFWFGFLVLFFFSSHFALGNYCVTPKVLSRSWEIWQVLVSRHPTRTHSLGRTGALRKGCFGRAAELPTVEEAWWSCLGIFNWPIEWIKRIGKV